MLKTAFRFMSYDKLKTVVALLGVVISTYLIGQQTGVFIFLTNAMTALVDNIETDIWVVDSRTTNSNALAPIDVRTGRQIESIAGVKKAYPLVIAGSSAKFSNGQTYGVQLVGAQAPEFVGGPWKIIHGTKNDLLKDGAFSFDYFDRRNLGESNPGDVFELAGKKAHLAVQTRGARGFGASYMFTTMEKARYYGKIPNTKVSAYLVRVNPGEDPVRIKNIINKNIYGVKAWLPEEFSAQTKSTILASSGIATSTGTMVVFGVFTGLVIICLTLYSAAVDRSRDYATMKAIGAGNGYIARLILTQAIIIGVSGFIIGTGFMELFRIGISYAGVSFTYPNLLRFIFFITVMVISLAGAWIAIRKISQSEPASVFRNQ